MAVTRPGLAAGAIGLALVSAPAVLIGLVLFFSASEPTCTTAATVNIEAAALLTVDGYTGEQLVNAAHIAQAGADLDLSQQDQTIGIMTAMGESSLRNISYGDGAINPDGSVATSIGLFQQQAGWGSTAERMDPYRAATLFFQALVKAVPNPERQSIEPTLVAHRTQVNADPLHYEKYWQSAVDVLAAIATGDLTSCTAAGGGAMGLDGWASPASGPVTDGFGPRTPICDSGNCTSSFHRGLDLAGGGCGSPVYAAHDGTVTWVGYDGYGNGTIRIDHGDGISTKYLHEYLETVIVRTGDLVTAGGQIAAVGNSGQSKGCHLHFEIHIDGEAIDPRPFLAERGLTYD